MCVTIRNFHQKHATKSTKNVIMYIKFKKKSHNVRKIPLEFNSWYTLNRFANPLFYIDCKDRILRAAFRKFPLLWYSSSVNDLNNYCSCHPNKVK